MLSKLVRISPTLTTLPDLPQSSSDQTLTRGDTFSEFVLLLISARIGEITEIRLLGLRRISSSLRGEGGKICFHISV